MKAQDLWAGHEYAYKENKPRGVETPLGAQRVKVIRTERKKRSIYSERMSTLATVEFLDKETGETTGTTRTVRARDIFDWWIDYEDRIADRQRRIDAANAEEERAKREKLDEDNRLRVALHLRTGIPQSMINFDMYGRVSMQKQEIKEWLNGNP